MPPDSDYLILLDRPCRDSLFSIVPRSSEGRNVAEAGVAHYDVVLLALPCLLQPVALLRHLLPGEGPHLLHPPSVRGVEQTVKHLRTEGHQDVLANLVGVAPRVLDGLLDAH